MSEQGDNMQRRFHEVASIFPMMSDEEIESLARDIEANGQRQPVILHPEDGSIIDGRNRFMACRKLGREPITETWDGKGELLAYVLSLNLERRHLNESQRAMVAAKVATLGRGANQHRSIDLPSQEQAAEQLNVSVPSLKRARVVQEQGAPELAAEVEAGRVAVSAASEVARLPREEQREIVAKGEAEILEAAKKIRAQRTERRRQERVEKLAEISTGNAPLDGSVGRHPILLADPPWRYEHAESESRAIENQYPTMALDEICALDVASVTTDDAVLFLWATSPKLTEAFEVLRAWGFEYRTCLVWDKEKIGMGYWARQQHELLLVCTKGHPPTPPPAARPSSVIRAPRSEHSAKPEAIYQIIEAMYPELPKLELFCRAPRNGWAVWGNQAA